MRIKIQWIKLFGVIYMYLNIAKFNTCKTCSMPNSQNFWWDRCSSDWMGFFMYTKTHFTPLLPWQSLSLPLLPWQSLPLPWQSLHCHDSHYCCHGKRSATAAIWTSHQELVFLTSQLQVTKAGEKNVGKKILIKFSQEVCLHGKWLTSNSHSSGHNCSCGRTHVV